MTLKGVWHEISNSRFSSWISLPLSCPLGILLEPFQIFTKFRGNIHNMCLSLVSAILATICSPLSVTSGTSCALLSMTTVIYDYRSVTSEQLLPVVNTSDFYQFIEIGDYFITGDNDTGDNLSLVTATTVLLTPAMKQLNKISLPTP